LNPFRILELSSTLKSSNNFYNLVKLPDISIEIQEPRQADLKE
jgi:hypothetical protein